MSGFYFAILEHDKSYFRLFIYVDTAILHGEFHSVNTIIFPITRLNGNKKSLCKEDEARTRHKWQIYVNSRKIVHDSE